MLNKIRICMYAIFALTTSPTIPRKNIAFGSMPHLLIPLHDKPEVEAYFRVGL